MKQSKLESAIETVLQVATGFWISFLVWTLIVAPLYGIPYSGVQGLSITGIFTVTSLMRMYTIRRFFNNGYHKLAHEIATRLVGKEGPEGTGQGDTSSSQQEGLQQEGEVPWHVQRVRERLEGRK